jgi:Nuclease-related domain
MRKAMAEQRELDLEAPGAGSRRQFAPRRANRERRTLEHPHLEEQLAAFLMQRCPGVIVLHDRRMPGGGANIDHLAVAPSGVYVIDAKRYRGRVEVRKPISGDEELLIAGRDRSELVEGLEGRVRAVRATLNSLGERVLVHGCLCFLNPSTGGSVVPLAGNLRIKGIPLCFPRRLAKRLNEPGELVGDQAQLVAEALAHEFRPA